VSQIVTVYKVKISFPPNIFQLVTQNFVIIEVKLYSYAVVHMYSNVSPSKTTFRTDRIGLRSEVVLIARHTHQSE